MHALLRVFIKLYKSAFRKFFACFAHLVRTDGKTVHIASQPTAEDSGYLGKTLLRRHHARIAEIKNGDMSIPLF